ncbi:Mevalonate kinase [Acorus gramineus]|uniref:Mevalonate kinase n=1 Tax=Acorus gramineus TaxID=55184 RepID=A0AAV9BWT8_ACOGR|nr:Mevalonate kinase [Acorus gramineus]
MEIRARAPGKIILAGEHAVVHGSTAVAASIDLYSHVSLRFLGGDEGSIKLSLKDMNLEFSWDLRRLEGTLSKTDGQFPHPSSPRAYSSEFIQAVASLVDEQSIPEAKIGLSAGVSAFLWLYIQILGFKPSVVTITSELPLGSGLGSSASFCVSLVAAFLVASGSMTLNSRSSGWAALGEGELELVNKWAFEGEKIIHGKPSGIDNTVSTFGNMIMFRSGELTRIKSSMPIRMLITNTKVGRNTKALVAGVFKRSCRHPDAMASVFSAVDSISKELSSIIQSPVHDDISITEKEGQIEELMEMNQGLLQCMGVSHSSIETVLRTTLRYKLASKLTGAGGGGCVLTLLPALLSNTVVDKVVAELESCGFQCIIAGIGGQGVEIFASDNS